MYKRKKSGPCEIILGGKKIEVLRETTKAWGRYAKTWRTKKCKSRHSPTTGGTI